MQNQCEALALRTKDLHFPHWTRHDLVECHHHYFILVDGFATDLTARGEDPKIVGRALRYLSHSPPPVAYVPWFSERMGALLDLACPRGASPPDGEPFFLDLTRGMNHANLQGIRGTEIEEFQAVEIVAEEVSDPADGQGAYPPEPGRGE